MNVRGCGTCQYKDQICLKSLKRLSKRFHIMRHSFDRIQRNSQCLKASRDCRKPLIPCATLGVTNQKGCSFHYGPAQTNGPPCQRASFFQVILGDGITYDFDCRHQSTFCHLLILGHSRTTYHWINFVHFHKPSDVLLNNSSALSDEIDTPCKGRSSA